MEGNDGELYRQAFRRTEIPTVITDLDFVITDVNSALVEFTGYPRDELEGTLPLRLFSEPEIYEEALGTLRDGDKWTGHFEAETKQGDLVYGRGSVTPLVGGAERRGYCGIFIDLTQRRRYERALRVIQRVLRHDLRNEMTVVRGRAELVGEGVEQTEEVWDSLQTIFRVTSRLIERSRRAQELEEILYDGLESSTRPMSLHDPLHSQVAAAEQRFAGTEFVLDLGPDVEVRANDLLEDVIGVVLENAVVHNDDPVHVKVRTQDIADRVVLRIADNGPGIPDDRKERIFGRAEESKLSHGKGFGLFFADFVIDTYDGTIWVTDNSMGGSTFTISLPTL